MMVGHIDSADPVSAGSTECIKPLALAGKPYACQGNANLMLHGTAFLSHHKLRLRLESCWVLAFNRLWPSQWPSKHPRLAQCKL